MPNLFLFLYAAVQYMLRPGPGQQGIRTVQYSDVHPLLNISNSL